MISVLLLNLNAKLPTRSSICNLMNEDQYLPFDEWILVVTRLVNASADCRLR